MLQGAEIGKNETFKSLWKPQFTRLSGFFTDGWQSTINRLIFNPV
jgi:hypothetical protein